MTAMCFRYNYNSNKSCGGTNNLLPYDVDFTFDDLYLTFYNHLGIS